MSTFTFCNLLHLLLKFLNYTNQCVYAAVHRSLSLSFSLLHSLSLSLSLSLCLFPWCARVQVMNSRARVTYMYVASVSLCVYECVVCVFVVCFWRWEDIRKGIVLCCVIQCIFETIRVTTCIFCSVFNAKNSEQLASWWKLGPKKKNPSGYVLFFCCCCFFHNFSIYLKFALFVANILLNNMFICVFFFFVLFVHLIYIRWNTVNDFLEIIKLYRNVFTPLPPKYAYKLPYAYKYIG